MVSFPVIAYQLWRFVAPGLYRSEKQAFLPFLIASPVLFLVGAAFAHYVVTPIAMTFFLGFADAYSLVTALMPGVTDGTSVAEVAPRRLSDTGIDIVFQGKVNETLDISLKLILAFGLCFQLPVLLTLMGKAGLATSAGLAGMRKYAIVLILIVAALVTPPDVMSQLILFFAVYPLVRSVDLPDPPDREAARGGAAGPGPVGRGEDAAWKGSGDQGMTDALERIAAALERLAPRRCRRRISHGRGLRLAHRARPAGAGGRMSAAWTCRCWSASTGRAIRCWRTPATSPPGCLRTTRCSGARGGWGSPAWSRPSMRRCGPKGMT
jgi:hypothetical protein